MLNVLCLLALRQFFSTANTSDQVGNVKIKLMGRPVIDTEGREKHWEISFCWDDLLEVKGIKPSTLQEYQITMFWFYTLAVQSIHIYTQDSSLSRCWRKHKSNFPWQNRLLTLEQFIEQIHVVSLLPEKPAWETDLQQKCKEMQPRVSLAFLAARAHCRLELSSVPTRTPRAFPAELLSSWVAPSTYWRLQCPGEDDSRGIGLERISVSQICHQVPFSFLLFLYSPWI